MRIASAKHVLRADFRPVALWAALLGSSAALALPATSAVANVTGGVYAAAPTATTEPAGSATNGGGGSAPTGPQASKPALATWFGPGFYGSKTACGQTMSPALVGVASRTLACGTLIQISYHGRHLTVPVVDRGPYGRIGASWDLTAGTARALKVKETVRITTEIVGSLPNTPSLGQPLEPSSMGSGTTSAGATPSATTASTTGGAAAS
jgi:rare lipoprotein A (peptidoglycan hydrolase)